MIIKEVKKENLPFMPFCCHILRWNYSTFRKQFLRTSSFHKNFSHAAFYVMARQYTYLPRHNVNKRTPGILQLTYLHP